MKKFIELTGKNPGPTSVILAGVHGDERGGIEALKKLLPTLQIEKGRVFLGYGNPRAIETKTRYIEANLNRMFADYDALTSKEKESYEYKRAQFLKTYLDKADALLDVHASSIPGSRTFIICEPNAKSIVEFLPTNLVVSGFDDVEPGATDYYMNRAGKIGICVECGYMKNPQSADIAEENIIAFLKAMGHIENNLIPQNQSYIRMFKKYFTKTNNFTLSKPFENFEEIEKGQLIGLDGKEKVMAPKKSLILFAHNGSEVGHEGFLLGEQKESLV